MYSYISEFEKVDILKKIKYLLEKKKISYTDGLDNIIIKNKNLDYEYLLYFANIYTPLYLMVSSDIKNISSDIIEIYENVNNSIDEYDNLLNIIIDIDEKIKKIEQKKLVKIPLTNNFIIGNNKKSIEQFELELDAKKDEFILNQNNLKSKTKCQLFSARANIEMIRDQILKLYADDKYDILIDNFPQIKILAKNFSFVGSNGLIVSIELDTNYLNLLSEPPKIKISANKVLKDNILKVITELKPFTDIKSWSVKYSISESVQNIFNMIDSFGEIEQEFTSEFDSIIGELEYLVSIRNKNTSDIKLLELFDKELVDFQNKSNSTNNKLGSYWKKGTGYGNNKSQKWDIDKYINNLNEKKNKISHNYNKFINYLSINYNGALANKLTLSEGTIGRIISLLINYLQNEEIDKSNAIIILNLIYDNFSLFKSNKVNEFGNLLKLLEGYVEDNDLNHKLFDSNNIQTKKLIENVGLNINKKDELYELIGSQSFKLFTDTFKGFHYKEQTMMDSIKLTRLKKEFNILKKSISVNKEASIFFWIEKNKLEKMRFIISGPTNTPYDQGLYIFDMTLSDNFPSKPPLVHFSNNGGVRFNPNLYNNGKVCLSLLGTWNGDKGESWNSSTSTFFQLLVSIQSQILIEEPFFNEPGYEKQIGTQIGNKNSTEYNDNIRQYNLDYAINGLIEGIIISKSAYPEFENIIRNYFKFKRDRIIENLNKWEAEYNNETKKNKFTKSKNKFIELSNQL